MNVKMTGVGLEQEVREIVAKYLKVSISDVKLESSLDKDLGIDSFGKFELTFEIQGKYGTEISDDELLKIFTVRDIVQSINQATKGKS
jgi:acyl carrier protein